MSDSNVDIKIRTQADTAGAKAVASALGDVNAAAKGSAKTIEDRLGDQAKRSVEGLNRTFEGLGQAVQGGATGVRGLGNAIAGVFQALGKATWVGWVISGISLIIANLEKLKAMFGTTAEDTEAAAKRMEEALKMVREEARQLGEQKLDTLRANLDAIAAAAKQTYDDLGTALERAEELATAQDQLELSRIERDPNLSEEEKVRRRAAVAEGAAARKSATAVKLAEGEAERARTVQGGAAQQETAAAGEVARIQGVISARKKVVDEANAEIARSREQLKAELADIEKNDAALPGADSLITKGAKSEAYRRAQERERGAFSRRESITGEAGQVRGAALEAELAAALKQLDAANAAAIAGTEALIQAEKNLGAVREQRAKVDAVEKTRRDEEAAAQAAQAAERDRAKREAAQAAAERELADVDVQNLGVRTAAKVAGLPKGLGADQIAAATEKAKAVAEGPANASELDALARELGPLLLAIQAIPNPGERARQEAANMQAIIQMVRDIRRRIEAIEQREKNNRTR